MQYKSDNNLPVFFFPFYSTLTIKHAVSGSLVSNAYYYVAWKCGLKHSNNNVHKITFSSKDRDSYSCNHLFRPLLQE